MVSEKNQVLFEFFAIFEIVNIGLFSISSFHQFNFFSCISNIQSLLDLSHSLSIFKRNRCLSISPSCICNQWYLLPCYPFPHSSSQFFPLGTNAYNSFIRSFVPIKMPSLCSLMEFSLRGFFIIILSSMIISFQFSISLFGCTFSQTMPLLAHLFIYRLVATKWFVSLLFLNRSIESSGLVIFNSTMEKLVFFLLWLHLELKFPSG